MAGGRLTFGLAAIVVPLWLLAAPPQPSSPSASRAVQREMTLDRQALTVTLEQQVANLQRSVRILQQKVQALELQANTQNDGEAAALAGRLATLENVLRVNGNSVELRAQGPLTLRSYANMSLNASGNITVSGASTALNSGVVQASGTFRSPTAIHDSVISANYTPGAGNVW